MIHPLPQIDFTGFASLLGEHNFLTTDDLRDAFMVFDQDGDGFIDADELGAFLQAMGEPVTPEQVYKTSLHHGHWPWHCRIP